MSRGTVGGRDIASGLHRGCLRRVKEAEAERLRSVAQEADRERYAHGLPKWLLLDADKRTVASVRAASADAARERFKARGLTGAWLRPAGDAANGEAGVG